jgi:hypothetical protein
VPDMPVDVHPEFAETVGTKIFDKVLLTLSSNEEINNLIDPVRIAEIEFEDLRSKGQTATVSLWLTISGSSEVDETTSRGRILTTEVTIFLVTPSNFFNNKRRMLRSRIMSHMKRLIMSNEENFVDEFDRPLFEGTPQFGQQAPSVFTEGSAVNTSLVVTFESLIESSSGDLL